MSDLFSFCSMVCIELFCIYCVNKMVESKAQCNCCWCVCGRKNKEDDYNFCSCKSSLNSKYESVTSDNISRS